MKVTLTVHGQERNGERFEFAEPGSLVFGRSDKAQCQIVHDPYISRFHFLLLINPPEVRLRNLSRTNGTLVDGTLYTQQGPMGEAAEAATLVKPAADQHGTEASLHDGSEIEAGYTRITVAIESPVYCVECGRSLDGIAEPDSTPMCEPCRAKHSAEPPPEAHTVKKPLAKGAAGHPGPRPPVLADTPAQLGAAPARKSRQGSKRPGPTPRRPAPASPKTPVDAKAGRAPNARRLIREILRKHRPAQAELPSVPGYRIERRLGVGGMGMVVQATRLSDSQVVAMKMIRPDRPPTPEAIGRFRREIRITGALKHQNIVSIYDSGEVGGVFWYAMEFVRNGLDVERRLKQAGGRLSVEEALRIILEALDGLAHAHGQGIVHRDLKPANILLPAHGERVTAKLTDFGIAKSLEDAGLNGSILTKPALAMGTLPFMPPEQARDVRTSQPTADVFAMGATLYWMLTGKAIRDFSRNVNEAVLQVLSEPPIPIRRRDSGLTPQLALVVDKALSPEPSARYAEAGSLAAALRCASS